MELVAQGLVKRVEGHPALAGVDLKAGPGVLAVLGPNGAGKSTLLRILATVVRPDHGEIWLGGHSYASDLRRIRQALGYLPGQQDWPDHLTPRRLLHYVAELKQLGPTEQPEKLLDALQILPLADRPLRELSGGQKRRVGIAQALLGQPRLLVLDELTRGIDPVEREQILRLVADPRAGRVVVLASHVPSEVAAIASQVLVLKEGRALYAGDLGGLCAKAEGHVWEVEVNQAEADRIGQQALVSRAIAQPSGRVRLRLVGPAVAGAEPVAPTLEDAYLLIEHGLVENGRP